VDRGAVHTSQGKMHALEQPWKHARRPLPSSLYLSPSSILPSRIISSEIAHANQVDFHPNFHIFTNFEHGFNILNCNQDATMACLLHAAQLVFCAPVGLGLGLYVTLHWAWCSALPNPSIRNIARLWPGVGKRVRYQKKT